VRPLRISSGPAGISSPPKHTGFPKPSLSRLKIEAALRGKLSLAHGDAFVVPAGQISEKEPIPAQVMILTQHATHRRQSVWTTTSNKQLLKEVRQIFWRNRCSIMPGN